MSQIIIGTVTANKMKNTVVVEVRSKVKHPLYKKLISRTSKFKAHTDLDLNIGQKVKIQETKPISKTVHFKVLKTIE